MSCEIYNRNKRANHFQESKYTEFGSSAYPLYTTHCINTKFQNQETWKYFFNQFDLNHLQEQFFKKRQLCHLLHTNTCHSFIHFKPLLLLMWNPLWKNHFDGYRSLSAKTVLKFSLCGQQTRAYEYENKCKLIQTNCAVSDE